VTSAKPAPQIVIFDMDGVLVDVRSSFHRSILETVYHFTGIRVDRDEIHRWKNRSGYNDDWRLTTDWIRKLGRRVHYDEVKAQFHKFYWGEDGRGFVTSERWLVPHATLRKLARRAELAIFTGRTRQELVPTLTRFGVRDYFQRVVTTDDVRRSKPDPEGLLRILEGRHPASAVYLGDNVDDALAARAAGVPFLGVLPHRSAARRLRAARLRRAGALAILGHVRELETWLR
jgi:HAD superfamily hydrolase (TIGR01548 family)